MSLPKWRYVECGFDSETTYQCLQCKRIWMACESPEGWTYCPHCACKWVGEHDCRPHNTPRWKWDMWPHGQEPFKPYDPDFWAEQDRKENAKRVWVIECRTRFKGSDWTPWKFDQRVFGCCGETEAGKGTMSGWHDAKHVLTYLRRDRQSDEWIEYEFRAAIMTKGKTR